MVLAAARVVVRELPSGGVKVIEREPVQVTHPEIGAQWHWALNEGLTLVDVTDQSGFLAWWICDQGHEWQETVVSRTSCTGDGCPWCASQGFGSAGRRSVLAQPEAGPTRFSSSVWRC